MKKMAVLVPVILAIIVIFSLLSLMLITGRNERTVMVEIRQGTPFNRAASLLREKEVIRGRGYFRALAVLVGGTRSIQAGRYMFRPHEPLISVVMKLKRGDVMPWDPMRVTFPEGSSIYRMGTILEAAGYRHFAAFRSFVNSPFTERMGLEFEFVKDASDLSLEGFLFPDTYVFDGSISAEALARLMLRRFNSTIWRYWQEHKQDAKHPFYATLALASIIEKEAQKPEERGIISSVFHNRLDRNMPLAACPTVKYALERPTKRVYYYQLKVDSPFNTYIRRGFPPTPICNPGLASFKAAIYPEKTNYFYFVARDDGSHIFSSTWQEHEKARGRVRTPTPTR